jgi:hypothetical protein
MLGRGHDRCCDLYMIDFAVDLMLSRDAKSGLEASREPASNQEALELGGWEHLASSRCSPRLARRCLPVPRGAGPRGRR